MAVLEKMKPSDDSFVKKFEILLQDSGEANIGKFEVNRNHHDKS